MTNRRTPAKRTSTSSSWKPTRARSELVKAIAGAGGVVVVTALLIFIFKPGDTSSTPATVPDTTVTQPTVSTSVTTPAASTPAASTPAASTPAQP